MKPYCRRPAIPHDLFGIIGLHRADVDQASQFGRVDGGGVTSLNGSSSAAAPRTDYGSEATNL